MLIVLLGAAGGLLAWTLLEYIIHNVLGHWPKGKTFVSREHLQHHKDITYFSPLAKKLRGAVPVLGVLGGGLTWLVGVPFGLGFLASVVAGWVTYEWLHQSIHVNGPRSRYGRWAARHHLAHHFMRPNVNHGVTTPIWDIVFGTYENYPVVRVRRQDAALLPWLERALAEPAAGAGFLSDYEIR
jgi:sterol desaturase/sphingolipid hydroxylase (fatty acid hydroxylase superfamily)